MSPARMVAAELEACFPRVSGDEPAIDAEVDELIEFSPRERG